MPTSLPTLKTRNMSWTGFPVIMIAPVTVPPALGSAASAVVFAATALLSADCASCSRYWSLAFIFSDMTRAGSPSFPLGCGVVMSIG